MFSGDYTEQVLRTETCLLAKCKGRDLGIPEKLLGIGVTVIHDSINISDE